MEQLPAVEAKGIILKKGEVCHLICEANYSDYDYKINFPFTENGELYITNKRIIFIGSEKTHTFQNSSILKYELKREGGEYELRVYKENQSKLQPFTITQKVAALKDTLQILFKQVF